jgi:2-aminoadipate transaminase
MHGVLSQGRLEPHIETLRNGYQAKLTAMLDACTKHLGPLDGVHWIEPTGGLYVWLTLPAHVDAGPNGRLIDLALEEGMLYVPGQFCFPAHRCLAGGEPVQHNTIRLSFGVQSAERIGEGIEKLASALRKVM